MNSSFEIEFDFEDPGPAVPPTHRATWARLSIRVGGHTVTRVFDRGAKTIRDYIRLPLYPIAEWIAYRWWSLLYEPETPEKQQDYIRRHSLRLATDGFVFPDLSLAPEGKDVRVEWHEFHHPFAPLTFFGHGSAAVDNEHLRKTLFNLIQVVLKRLGEFGIADAPLIDEWRAISDTMRDQDELDYCILASMTGGDPYGLDEGQHRHLLESFESIGERVLLEDLCAVTSLESISDDISWLERCREIVTENLVGRELHSLKKRLNWKAESTISPWEVGYSRARELRSVLNLNGQVFGQTEDLAARLLGTPTVVDLEQRLFTQIPNELINAIAVQTRDSRFGIMMKRHGDTHNRFNLCRAFHGMLANNESTALVTHTHSSRQKTNRAFAAEFLAPANSLRQVLLQRFGELGSRKIGADTVQELADDFGVDTAVIVHQLINHRIARISSMTN